MFLSNTSQDKINALFSTLPDDRTEWNAASFDEKLQFWRQKIKEFAQEKRLSKQRLAFSSLQLQQRFEHQGSTPLCIDRVLKLLLDEGILVQKSEWNQSLSSKVTGFLFKSIYWGLGIQSNPILTQSDSLLIHLELLTETIDGLISVVHDMDNKLMDKLGFLELLKTVGFEEQDDVALIQQHLLQACLLCLEEHQGILIYKFLDKNLNPITQTDIGRVHLMQTARSLQYQIDDLEKKIEISQEQIKTCLLEKKKQNAMYHLKQKKNLESIVQKRIASLETLEILLHKINSTHTDIEILDAYKAGSKTLSEILGRQELQIDNVEATMENLQDALQDQQDLENAMNFGIEVDDGDLEKELDGLVEAEKVEQLAKELETLSIPSNDIPKREPDSEKRKEKSESKNVAPLPA
jgi:hypothetical protein